MKLKMIPMIDKINFLEKELEDSLKIEKNKDYDKIINENKNLKEELNKREIIFKEWNDTIDELDTKMSNIEKENKGNLKKII